mgnify:CR=1 FL=1
MSSVDRTESRLKVALGQPSVSLGPTVGGLELSRATPNPFSGQTRFSVTLERAGALDVGVYDLAGRKIATLFHGSGRAGTQTFTWNSRTDEVRRHGAASTSIALRRTPPRPPVA